MSAETERHSGGQTRSGVRVSNVNLGADKVGRTGSVPMCCQSEAERGCECLGLGSQGEGVQRVSSDWPRRPESWTRSHLGSSHHIVSRSAWRHYRVCPFALTAQMVSALTYRPWSSSGIAARSAALSSLMTDSSSPTAASMASQRMSHPSRRRVPV